MRWLVLVAGCALLSGCTTTESMPTFVLRFTMMNQSDEALAVGTEYPHCSTARLHDSFLEVDAPRPPGKALVYVEPRYDGGQFISLGGAPAAIGLSDADRPIPDGLEDGDGAIVWLAYDDGRLLVNGEPQTLPYTGTSKGQGAEWTANFTIEGGPHKIRVDHATKSSA
ncbi:MAG: hypothetical protein AABY18_07455 [Candidatus Thermoplasmatota archaeon]